MQYHLVFVSKSHGQQRKITFTVIGEVRALEVIRDYLGMGWTLNQVVPTDGYAVTQG